MWADCRPGRRRRARCSTPPRPLRRGSYPVSTAVVSSVRSNGPQLLDPLPPAGAAAPRRRWTDDRPSRVHLPPGRPRERSPVQPAQSDGVGRPPIRADLLSSLVSFTVDADADFDRPDIDVATESAADRLARFERVLETYMPVLYGNALRLTGNTEDAADPVQVTFERAFKAFDKYQPGTNLKAWLFRIQTNAHINDYRKAQRTPRLSDADTVEDWQMARAETHTARGLRSTETEVLEGIPEQVVTEALAALRRTTGRPSCSPTSRACVASEIAEIMGTPSAR